MPQIETIAFHPNAINVLVSTLFDGHVCQVRGAAAQDKGPDHIEVWVRLPTDLEKQLDHYAVAMKNLDAIEASDGSRFTYTHEEGMLVEAACQHGFEHADHDILMVHERNFIDFVMKNKTDGPIHNWKKDPVRQTTCDLDGSAITKIL